MENQFEPSQSGDAKAQLSTGSRPSRQRSSGSDNDGTATHSAQAFQAMFIDDAICILMQRLDCSSSAAFNQLRKTAQRTNGSILEVAIELVQSGAADADPDLSDVLGG